MSTGIIIIRNHSLLCRLPVPSGGCKRLHIRKRGTCSGISHVSAERTCRDGLARFSLCLYAGYKRKKAQLHDRPDFCLDFMKTKIEEYTKVHSACAGHVLLFRNWEEFLLLLYANNECVAMIVWYEYCKRNEQRIGMGGYVDRHNRNYMFAETHIFKTDLEKKNMDELLAYISETRERYSEYDLYPEFYLK